MQNEENKGCLSGIGLMLGYLCMLGTAALIATWWADDFMATLITAFLFWLWIPILIGAVIAFILSFRLKTLHHKILFGLGIINILLISAYLWIQAPRQDCSADIMAEHYEHHKEGMRELEAYARQALDSGAYIHLEFDGQHIPIFHVQACSDSLISSHWDADGLADSLRAVVGLTADEMEGLRKRLTDLGCISVDINQSVPGINIGFRRVGLGMYFFRLYDKPMTATQWQAEMDAEEDVPYNRQVVFEYGAGAIGSMAFPGKDEYLQRQKKGPRKQ
ncbi:hypothetical protein [Prevotella sp. KH2C16]|uniref:hypothetical protein n=1 Tax=Prevotella sp. KH2C16 TaxID=1855325 RepID=UPI0008F1B513|nr:hypothetical protein [Prevotella sp. KH2C16]SFG49926.1 hypothetical protein SAMN05216383_11725 [Prevotella sp. KH2C16]